MKFSLAQILLAVSVFLVLTIAMTSFSVIKGTSTTSISTASNYIHVEYEGGQKFYILVNQDGDPVAFIKSN